MIEKKKMRMDKLRYDARLNSGTRTQAAVSY
jgi:hypothetical protein